MGDIFGGGDAAAAARRARKRQERALAAQRRREESRQEDLQEERQARISALESRQQGRQLLIGSGGETGQNPQGQNETLG